ncbi:MAG: DUF4350 domain-containing protein [Planctomycetota bacterium]|nr:DUF4350 domain-containing protein [Planctomycetota bacterium]
MFPRFGAAIGVRLALLLILGVQGTGVMGQDRLPVRYGQRGGQGRVSLNGTSAFARLLQEYDHDLDVQSTSRLTPRIDRHDALFWFPDSDREDYTEEHERLEEWLRSGTDRRLIIVGRHYDATIDYLTQIGQSEDSEQGLDYRRWLAEAVSVSHLESLEQQETYFDGWVEWTPGSRRRSSQVGGPWAAGLENANLTTSRYPNIPSSEDQKSHPTRSYEVKLEADGKPFAVAIQDSLWNGGEVIVISNGSFLLNYGLTDERNRQVVANMLDDLGVEDDADLLFDSNHGLRDVLFLESDEAGLRVMQREESGQKTMWDWMTEWPFSFFIPHFLVLGILIYFVFYPIFGRPKNLALPSSTDFGQHVEALGELMEKTRDRAYAIQHINHYYEQTKSDSRGLGSSAASSLQKTTKPDGKSRDI